MYLLFSVLYICILFSTPFVPSLYPPSAPSLPAQVERQLVAAFSLLSFHFTMTTCQILFFLVFVLYFRLTSFLVRSN